MASSQATVTDAGSLGRTLGPALATAGSVAVCWSPPVAGAVLLVAVAVLLRIRR